MAIINKRVPLALVSGLLVASLLFGGAVRAQDEAPGLPPAGLTPDSPLYFLDNWGKAIGLLLAFGPEARARKALAYAEERLAEAQAMASRNKAGEARRAAEGYDAFVNTAAAEAEEAKRRGRPEAVAEIVARATSKHLAVLDRVMDKVPEQARDAIARARESSMKGMESALRALAAAEPEKAAEISLAATESRLKRAKQKAEENKIEEVESSIREAEKLSGFGEEISAIARGLGKDTTTVDQLVAKATSVHLEVLAQVYEKVPEQAKQAIERAMARSMEDRAKAVESLKAKGALGGIPEEIPVPGKVPQDVKERLSKIKPGPRGRP